MNIVLAAAAMIILHVATGGEIDVNVESITNMRGPEGQANFVKGTNCLVSMSDGKYIAVRETCEQIRQIIGRQK